MSQKTFHLQPWTPKVQATAQQLVTQIHAVVPELEVLFMGAAALGLPGKNDIDLDILCNQKDVAAYTKKLVPVLGQPKEATDKLAAWEFMLNGFEVDCILSDPAISHVPLQRRRFEILRDSAELREAYKQLKESCDGLPYEEYEKQKVAFLEERVFSSKAASRGVR